MFITAGDNNRFCIWKLAKAELAPGLLKQKALETEEEEANFTWKCCFSGNYRNEPLVSAHVVHDDQGNKSGLLLVFRHSVTIWVHLFLP